MTYPTHHSCSACCHFVLLAAGVAGVRFSRGMGSAGILSSAVARYARLPTRTRRRAPSACLRDVSLPRSSRPSCPSSSHPLPASPSPIRYVPRHRSRHLPFPHASRSPLSHPSPTPSGHISPFTIRVGQPPHASRTPAWAPPDLLQRGDGAGADHPTTPAAHTCLTGVDSFCAG